MSDERRRQERHPAHLGTEIDLGEGKKADGITIDVSDSGALLLTRADLPVGTKVTLRILRLSGDNPPFVVHGEIVRSERLDPLDVSPWRARLAVKLVDYPSELQDEIHRASERRIELYGPNPKSSPPPAK